MGAVAADGVGALMLVGKGGVGGVYVMVMIYTDDTEAFLGDMDGWAAWG